MVFSEHNLNCITLQFCTFSALAERVHSPFLWSKASPFPENALKKCFPLKIFQYLFSSSHPLFSLYLHQTNSQNIPHHNSDHLFMWKNSYCVLLIGTGWICGTGYSVHFLLPLFALQFYFSAMQYILNWNSSNARFPARYKMQESIWGRLWGFVECPCGRSANHILPLAVLHYGDALQLVSYVFANSKRGDC